MDCDKFFKDNEGIVDVVGVHYQFGWVIIVSGKITSERHILNFTNFQKEKPYYPVVGDCLKLKIMQAAVGHKYLGIDGIYSGTSIISFS